MTDHLFDLIQSLSPTEKRYFKVENTSRSKKLPNYVQLFDAMDALTEYSEDKLIKKLKNKAIARKLSYEKNQLMEQLLKSLRAYTSDSRIDSQLKDWTKDVYLLAAKGQKELAIKRYNKVKKLAYKYDAFHVLLELMDWERLQIINKKSKNIKEDLARWQEEKKRVLEVVQNESELKNLQNSVFVLYKENSTSPSEDIKEQAAELAQHPLLSSEDNALSFRALLDYHVFKANYYDMVHDMDAVARHTQRIVHIWEGNPHRINANHQGYRTAVVNHIGKLQYLKKQEEILKVIQRMKQYKPQSFQERADSFQKFEFQELFALLNLGRFEEALDLITEIEIGLSEYISLLSPSSKMALCYNISVVYFLLEKLDDCLIWVGKVIDYQVEVRNDIRQAARLLELVLLWEKKEFNYLVNVMESRKRYFMNNENASDFELFCYKKVKGLIKQKSNAEIKAYLEEFHQELEATIDPKIKKNPPLQEELKIWLESRLRGVSMDVVFKESLEKEQQLT